MDTNIKTNIWLKIASGAARYVLGILILASGPLYLLLTGQNLMILPHAIVHPILTFFVTPQIIIGFYFMFTGKWRPRVDLTLILIALAFTYAFSTFRFNA